MAWNLTRRPPMIHQRKRCTLEVMESSEGFWKIADIMILLESRGDTELWEVAADPATDPPPAAGKILTRDKLSSRDKMSLNLQHPRQCWHFGNTEEIALYWEGADLHARYFFNHIYPQFLTLTPCVSTLLLLTPLTFLSSFSFFS